MIKDSFLGRIPGGGGGGRGGTDKRDPILSWLQAGMLRPNGTLRLNLCLKKVKSALEVLIFLANKTFIGCGKLKIVVNSADDGTSQPVCNVSERGIYRWL